MTDQDHNHSPNLDPAPPDSAPGTEFDPASRSLSEALGISFVVLKIIMAVLIGLFLISGFETVGPEEQALILRFGKIRTVGQNRILDSEGGPYWVLPYPIEEIIKIPVDTMIDLDIRSFWYYQSKQDLINESAGITNPVREQTLDPIKDGYCLIRSEQRSDAPAGLDGSDYNIVHSKWRLTYKIKKPELFFKNVLVEGVKPGDIYFDVMTKSITPLLKSLLDNAVVTAMVNFTIDEAIKSQDTIPRLVKKLLQEKLDGISTGEMKNICGIEVDSVHLTDITWPRQVNEAFQKAITGSQDSQKKISQARTEARNILNEAAGPVAEELLAALHDDSADKQAMEALWSRLAGDAKEIIFEAEAYRTRIEADAMASADYLRSLLPEYRKNPEIVIDSIYRDAIKDIFANADEKFVVEPTENGVYRIALSRDPTIKRTREKAKQTPE